MGNLGPPIHTLPKRYQVVNKAMSEKQAYLVIWKYKLEVIINFMKQNRIKYNKTIRALKIV